MSDAPTADYYEIVKPTPSDADHGACPGCNGARYVRYERPVGHILFGKYTACTRCVAGEAEVPGWAK